MRVVAALEQNRSIVASNIPSKNRIVARRRGGRP